MRTSPSDAAAENLFYGGRDYQRATRTLARLRQSILWKFAVVGGIANRALYPDWAERNRAYAFNDLDVVLLPSDGTEPTSPLSAGIKADFFVNHISELARYFSMIDRQDFVGVDIFTSLRGVETQALQLEGKSYLALTPEERYLSMARDVYQTLSHDRALDPKHVEFLEFLRPRIDWQKVMAIWPAEEKIIRRSEKHPFAALDDYLDQIKSLLASGKDLIGRKIPGTQKRTYNPPRLEAFGITVENEADFYASYEAKGRFWRE